MLAFRWSAIIIALLCAFAAGGLLGEAQGKKKNKSSGGGKASAADRAQVLKHINEERKKHDLHPLKLSAKMDEQAQHWADHLHKVGKLVHGDFKGDRGQCIAEGQPSPDAVTKAWMSDKGHRDILLGKSYKELGVGRAGKFWVTDFK